MGKNDSDENGEHWMLRDKRATRGKRMASLVGEAEEEDEQFWGNEVWQENDSDAESYSTEEEVKPDQFDSDFNDTEDDDDDEDDGSDNDREASGKKSNRYKDPSGGKKAAAAPSSAPDASKPKTPKAPTEPRAKKPRMEVQFDEEEGPRAVRQSTKVKTINADMARERRDAEQKHKSRPPVQRVKAMFDQDDMLREALQTEEENVRWLEARKHQQAERDLLAEKASKQSTQHKDFIRYHSSRGSNKTITFSSLDIMPKIFSDKSPPLPEKLCVITGLPAKYKDPLTQMPYATLDAFREIRRRYA